MRIRIVCLVPLLGVLALPGLAKAASDTDEDIDARFRQMDRELRELRDRDAETDHRLDALEGRVDSVEEATKYRTGGVGLGLSFPLGDAAPTAGFVTANWQWAAGYYYFGKGGGGAINASLRFGRFNLRPVGLGFMYYVDRDDVFTSRWLDRHLDLTVPIGIDLRIVKGLQVSGQLTWFFPNPVTVGYATKDAEKAERAKTNPDFLGKAGDIVGNSYIDAAKTPRIELVFKWVF